MFLSAEVISEPNKMLTLLIVVPFGLPARHLPYRYPTMDKLFLLTLSLLASVLIQAQKVDSIFFHLYTDSLKKGTHNYINVDGKLSNGQWKPMTTREVKFSSSACEFSGNELIVPADCKEEKITITAELKADPSRRIERTIWIKKKPDDEVLPTKEEILRDMKGKRKRS